MSPEVSRIVKNTPVVEEHGSYVVRAKFGMGVPVLSVSKANDEHKAVHLCVYTAMARITFSSSMALRLEDELWCAILGLFDDLGEYDAVTRQVSFKDEAAVIAALDCFLDRLEML